MQCLKYVAVIIAGFLLLRVNFVLGRDKRRSYADILQDDGTEETDSDSAEADSPADLPKSSWKDALKLTKKALKDKQISTQAAGLSYYATLSFFPALLGVATIYATFAGPEALSAAVDQLQHFIPPAIYETISQQIEPLTSAGQRSLGVAALLSVGALIWTTSGGVQNLVKATNVAYEVRETRGLIKLRLTSIVLSVVLLILGSAIILMLLLQPSGLASLGLPRILTDWLPYIRWPVLIVLISLLLSVVYRYAPNRKSPHWSWVSWGAVAATVVWLIGTVAFFFYVQQFGNFNKTYGIFAGIIVLMIWFNLTSLIVLVGAQVNKKLEDVSDADTQTD